MNALEKFPDIAVPNKNISCPDNELFHRRHVQAYMQQYAELCGTPIARPRELMERFFEYNAAMAYAGFKSMPNRHKRPGVFLARGDIRFITLMRRDIASTVASFLVALETGSFRRAGEPHAEVWRFVPARHGASARSNLAYIRRSIAWLRQAPNAIAIAYEDLCDPAYRNAALDDFFGRPVRIDNPKPPTSGSSYVANWDEFRAFVGDALRN